MDLQSWMKNPTSLWMIVGNQVVTVDGNPSWCWILWKGEGSQKFALKFCEDIKQNDSKMWDDGWLCCSVA